MGKIQETALLSDTSLIIRMKFFIPSSLYILRDVMKNILLSEKVLEERRKEGRKEEKQLYVYKLYVYII